MGNIKRLRKMALIASTILLALVSVISYRAISDFFVQAQTAPGIVTATPFGRFHPEIEFRTKDGREITYWQGGWVFFQVGQTVLVYYDPGNPQNSPTVKQLGAAWFVPTIFLFLALLSFIGALI